jgi:hypothetical protein
MQTIAGVSRRTQFNYEQSIRLPDVSYLTALTKHGFDVYYLITGTRAPRFGTVNEELLRHVFITVEKALSDAGRALDADKRATLVALVYQTSAESGQVDPTVVQKALALIY